MTTSEKPVDKRRGPRTPEQKAAWRASVAKSNNKPAGGGLSREMPATGMGWGGPPRDPGSGPAKLITPINEHPASAATMTGAERIAARRKNEEISARALAKIDSLIDSDHDGLALQASIAALNRTEGLPVARQITADATGSDLRSWLRDNGDDRKNG